MTGHPLPRTSEEIAVIVVNYRTADLAIAAVESVRARDHGGRRATVHLVDNASPGDDAAVFVRTHSARGWGDSVQLYLETENHGFGGGNNVVLEALARAETPPGKVFLLNPDARLENDAAAILACALDDMPGAAAAGAALVDETGQPRSGAFRFPSMVGEIVRVINFGPLDRLLGSRRPSLPPDHPGGPVDWVSGAAVMFRFDALRKVGFFDPTFFLYYEEVELMLRLARGGWKTLYVPEAVVTHFEGVATGRGKRGRSRQPDYLYRSWRHYFTLAKGRAGALVLALLVLPAGFVNMIVRRLGGEEPNVPSHFLTDHCRKVIWPLLVDRRGA
ncbi:glycosyltransferase family 2 protein [Palleronia sp. KMU-117]|uniref:glycosyltransferase family 2 protein n=1 Tax=Palleronia sp. KMU-117 TaxID=3434108 RepID=UPI003D7057F5